MNDLTTSKNLTNQEISALFPEQVKSGKAFVFHVSQPSEGSDGEMYQQMYIAQQRNLSGGSSSVLAMFLGWNNGRIYRVIQNAKPEILVDKGIKPGYVLETLNIQVEHKRDPQYATQNVRIYPDAHEQGGNAILSGGEPSYEWTTLVEGEPQDNLLRSDSTEAQTVTVEQVAEDVSMLEIDD